VFVKCTETNYHNYEVSTIWETETRMTPRKSARLLNGTGTGPKAWCTTSNMKKMQK